LESRHTQIKPELEYLLKISRISQPVTKNILEQVKWKDLKMLDKMDGVKHPLF
jgi:hypothetical protein